MSPQQPVSSESNPKVVELEVKLKRAYKTIKKLRTRVAELDSQQELLTSSTVRLPPEYPQFSSQRRYRSRSQPSVLALISVASLALVIGGLGAIAKFFFPHLFPEWIKLIPLRVTAATSSPLSLVSTQASSTSASSTQTSSVSELVYNVTEEPLLDYNLELQTIVDQVVRQVSEQQLSTSSLSLHLIDVQTQTFAEYRSQTPRFPASIAKLFWMVALFSQVEAGLQPTEKIQYTSECQTDICTLIQKSDNGAASRILDQLTQTSSQPNQPDKNYENWLKKRYSVNHFFQKAGYRNINISQKNFPVPEINMEEPQDWDLKMRGNPQKPIRNRITAEQTGRLMYEIVTQTAVSPVASSEMMKLLEQNLDPQIWTQEDRNSIAGFLGESLTEFDIRFFSKVGWTSQNRFEVAFIQSKSDNIAYILTVFGEDRDYAESEDIFPLISRLVYDRMKSLNSQE